MADPYIKCSQPTADGPCDRIAAHRGVCMADPASAEHLDAADPDGPKRPAREATDGR